VHESKSNAFLCDAALLHADLSPSLHSCAKSAHCSQPWLRGLCSGDGAAQVPDLADPDCTQAEQLRPLHPSIGRLMKQAAALLA
jgi:hypothetical protein